MVMSRSITSLLGIMSVQPVSGIGELGTMTFNTGSFAAVRMSARPSPVTKPSDHAPLRLLAELERRSPQEVFHAALAEYLESHRGELATTFSETQRAIASGDLDALTTQLAASAEAQADALMATLPESR